MFNSKSTEYVKKYKRDYYLTNRSKLIEQATVATKARYLANRAKVWELKRAPCTDCGRTFHPVAMDYDHRGGKVKGVGQMCQSHPWPAIEAEIAKCDLVCANCHRIRTFRRNNPESEVV